MVFRVAVQEFWFNGCRSTVEVVRSRVSVLRDWVTWCAELSARSHEERCTRKRGPVLCHGCLSWKSFAQLRRRISLGRRGSLIMYDDFPARQDAAFLGRRNASGEGLQGGTHLVGESSTARKYQLSELQ